MTILPITQCNICTRSFKAAQKANAGSLELVSTQVHRGSAAEIEADEVFGVYGIEKAGGGV